MKATKKSKRVQAKSLVSWKRLRFHLVSGLLFIFIGIVLGHSMLSNYWGTKDVAAQPASPPVTLPDTANASVTNNLVTGKPVRIDIPSVKISVPVANGIYNYKSKQWTLSKNNAHYALITPQPNNKEGNTFIYGHNRREVFSRLVGVKPGDKAIVTTDNGHVFTYTFRSGYETKPDDTSLFYYHGAPILTLQTCTGILYQNRYLLTFDLTGVS